mmetsp:Transcript_25688/g.68220  ORF Transcript_25688/g.68220 Transcript_25688/m.68220 type:complete len:625 (+) Transcript_25688:54-1928(+)
MSSDPEGFGHQVVGKQQCSEGEASSSEGDDVLESVGLLSGTATLQQDEPAVSEQAVGGKFVVGGFAIIAAAFLIVCVWGTIALMDGSSRRYADMDLHRRPHKPQPSNFARGSSPLLYDTKAASTRMPNHPPESSFQAEPPLTTSSASPLSPAESPMPQGSSLILTVTLPPSLQGPTSTLKSPLQAEPPGSSLLLPETSNESSTLAASPKLDQSALVTPPATQTPLATAIAVPAVPSMSLTTHAVNRAVAGATASSPTSASTSQQPGKQRPRSAPQDKQVKDTVAMSSGRTSLQASSTKTSAYRADAASMSKVLKQPPEPTLDEMPWRSLQSGQSLQLVPFMPAEETPPRPPWVWTQAELEHYRAPPPKRKTNIIWIHLHNYAGTFMCTLAHKKGEVVYKKNCNWPGDGVVGLGWGLKYAHRARCAERAEHAQITFSEIERELQSGDLGCKTAITGIMLRDPFRGARSTVLYHNFGYQLNGILKSIAAKKKMPRLGGHRGLPGDHTYQFFDNFGVRTLSGSYWLPPGEVTRKHLEAAKAVLARIDVIIVLEELEEHFPQFEKHFEWDMSRERANKKINGHTSSQYDAAMSAEDAALLKNLSALDYELYEFGKTLAAERTRVASKA